MGLAPGYSGGSKSKMGKRSDTSGLTGAVANAVGDVNTGAAGLKWQPCLLTWYDPALGGTNSSSGLADPHSAMANGQPYDASKNTCAAPPQYPFGTQLTFMYNSKAVTCVVTDRGGAIQGDHFDLSRNAAQTLGMISAGSVKAQFLVGSANAPGGSGGGGQGSQKSGDFSLSFGSLFSIAASDVAQFFFDAFIKFPAVLIGDYLIRPAWHWNQRAVMHYQQNILFGDKTGMAQVTTAVFWAFGYVLLWGDPDAKGITKRFTHRVPAHRSHLARNVRAAQAVPARRQLVKPKDVKQATAVKPKPVESAVPVSLVGTMTTHRPQRVTVSGHRANRTTDNFKGSRTGSHGAGQAEGAQQQRHQQAGQQPPPAFTYPRHRARSGPRKGGRGPANSGEGKNRS